MAPVSRLLIPLCCLVPLAALGSDRPDIRTGLWEYTHKTDTNGTPQVPAAAAMPTVPPEVLASMTPEMRARMEASMKARAGAGGPHVSRSCITDADLDHPFEKLDEKQSECTHQVLSRTSNSAVVAVQCQNLGREGGSAKGTFKWQASSPTAMSGTTDMTLTMNGRDMKVHTEITGHWVGSDCGDVKPQAHKAK